MIKVVCCVCGKHLREIPHKGEDLVSHGYCTKCLIDELKKGGLYEDYIKDKMR
jgi:predicted amidophosphoribosyltransferase